jgi:5-methylcytosine-specific restriction endonuclease McrA
MPALSGIATLHAMSKLSHTREKIYKTVARQLHGVVPCWVCGEHVLPGAATLEHIKPLSEGGNSHTENLAISHDICNNRRHATGLVTASAVLAGCVQRRAEVG